MATINIDMSYLKETKGTYVYKEDAMPGAEKLGVQYIKKATLGRTPPQSLTITITWANGQK